MQDALHQTAGPATGRRGVRQGLIAAAVALALAVAAYWLEPILFPQPDFVAAPDPGCSLHHGPCTATLAAGRIEVRFEPRPIPLAQAFRVRVATEGLAPRKIEIDFTGVEMNMGSNLVTLAPVADDSYAAEAVLPVCSSGPMKWRATVILHTGRGRILIPYVFDTGEEALSERSRNTLHASHKESRCTSST
ncbi:hypothetical protein [Pseudothauera rhizosphaerae]|uniref:hypothetical protein n=1 Tax=Pseudothauera rhizosphaerae TaxID=2565932 RepID=UPI001454E25F|nr:hypothetical protein [Pseudothauera rhizosphaerae]